MPPLSVAALAGFVRAHRTGVLQVKNSRSNAPGCCRRCRRRLTQPPLPVPTEAPALPQTTLTTTMRTLLAADWISTLGVEDYFKYTPSLAAAAAALALFALAAVVVAVQTELFHWRYMHTVTCVTWGCGMILLLNTVAWRPGCCAAA